MSDIWHWLSKTDPNVVIPVIGLPVMWLWHKIRGGKQESSKSIINSVIDNLTAELLDSYLPAEGDVKAYLQVARAQIERKVWAILEKRKVPRNKLTESLVHEAVERGTAWLGNELAKLRIPYQMKEMVLRLEATKAELAKAHATLPDSGASAQ